MEIPPTVRIIAEGAIAVSYLFRGLFDLPYRLYAGQFYARMANVARTSCARKALQEYVVPNATLVTIAVVVYQLAVAFSIMSGGVSLSRA
jgi:hypothetical protein